MCRDADAHYPTTSAMLIDNLTAKLYRTLPLLPIPLVNHVILQAALALPMENLRSDVGPLTSKDVVYLSQLW